MILAALNRYIAKLKQEDLDKLREKREYQAGIQKDIDVLNQQTQIVKERKIQEEKELEKKIVAYNQARILKEEEALREQQRIREEKERETQRLRELQEKAQDR